MISPQQHTDVRERALSLMRSFEVAIHPAMRDGLVDCVTHLLATAEYKARREERTKIAEWLDRNGHHGLADTLTQQCALRPPTPQNTPEGG